MARREQPPEWRQSCSLRAFRGQPRAQRQAEAEHGLREEVQRQPPLQQEPVPHWRRERRPQQDDDGAETHGAQLPVPHWRREQPAPASREQWPQPQQAGDEAEAEQSPQNAQLPLPHWRREQRAPGGRERRPQQDDDAEAQSAQLPVPHWRREQPTSQEQRPQPQQAEEDAYSEMNIPVDATLERRRRELEDSAHGVRHGHERKKAAALLRDELLAQTVDMQRVQIIQRDMIAWKREEQRDLKDKVTRQNRREMLLSMQMKDYTDMVRLAGNKGQSVVGPVGDPAAEAEKIEAQHAVLRKAVCDDEGDARGAVAAEEAFAAGAAELLAGFLRAAHAVHSEEAAVDLRTAHVRGRAEAAERERRSTEDEMLPESAQPPVVRDAESSTILDPSHFVDDVDEEYICAVCLNVVVTPMMCADSHMFCKGCIETALRAKGECPMDRRALCTADLRHVRVVENVVSKMRIRCPRAALQEGSGVPGHHGCDWVGQVCERAKHVEGCVTGALVEASAKLAAARLQVQELERTVALLTIELQG